MRAVASVSTACPLYITTVRSAISATTPMSWVMKRIDIPSSCWSSFNSSRIWAWMVTSSAVVGSSAISSFGLQASAMAIITRWRMPPENRCGCSWKRDFAAGMRTRSSRRTGLGLGRRARQAAVVDQRLGDLEADGEHRIEARHRLLEDHGDLVAAHVLHARLGQRQQIAPRQHDAAFDAAVLLRDRAA